MRLAVRRRLLGTLALAMAVLLLSACGNKAAARESPTNVPTAKPKVSVAVKVATHGNLGKILVNAAGYTLYRYTPDPKGKSTCTGTCAGLWPPLLVAKNQKPVSSGADLGSALAVISRPGAGHQVTYNGMPLYTYAKDVEPGEVKGQGVHGIWFVVHPSTGGAAPTPTSSSGNGY